MTRDDILALHPKNADAATLRAAIARAELLRRDLNLQTEELARVRSKGVLAFTDEELAQAAQDTAAATLAFERIDALLPLMRADLAKAEGAEGLAALRAGATPVQEKVAALETWQRVQLPKLIAIMGEGFRLQDAAQAERDTYLETVRRAYSEPAIRDAGELGVTVPPMPAQLPRAQFPNWQSS